MVLNFELLHLRNILLISKSLTAWYLLTLL
nr:MAG TPA: hypothetical protein [Caudoviricetes sp.]